MKTLLRRAAVVSAAIPAMVAVAGVPVPAQALARPTVGTLSDVNVNYGLTTRVTAPSTGATSYDWYRWSSGSFGYPATNGWQKFASGGTAYRSINLRGTEYDHMEFVKVVAKNSAGSTTSNSARVRVWGINPSYPAKLGTTVDYDNQRKFTISSPSYDATTRTISATVTFVRGAGAPSSWDLSAMRLRYAVKQNTTWVPLWIAQPGTSCGAGSLNWNQKLAPGASATGRVCLRPTSSVTSATSVTGGQFELDETGYPDAVILNYRGL